MINPIFYFFRKDPCNGCIVSCLCNNHCNEKTEFIRTEVNRIDNIYILLIIIVILIYYFVSIVDIFNLIK